MHVSMSMSMSMHMYVEYAYVYVYVYVYVYICVCVYVRICVYGFAGMFGQHGSDGSSVAKRFGWHLSCRTACYAPPPHMFASALTHMHTHIPTRTRTCLPMHTRAHTRTRTRTQTSMMMTTTMRLYYASIMVCLRITSVSTLVPTSWGKTNGCGCGWLLHSLAS